MTLSSQDVLKAFERIRVFQRGEQRAVHKPLLILLALARTAQDAPRMVAFEDIEEQFKTLLGEFGPSSAAGSRHYPFWHLATDGVWQLDGPPDFLNRPPAATPNLGELRRLHIAGGFAPDMDAALRRDPALRAQLAHQLLDAHFPETLHGDILQALGLALCALHHKVFDLGAFTILPDTYSLVFSQHAVAGEASHSMLLGFHGAGMIMPQSKDYYPRAEFLRWHEREVFKRPGRALI
jgi:predicted restriction endonuclease